MTFIVATNIVASRPPERRTLVPIVHLSVFLIFDLSFMHLLAPRSTCYSTYRNIMLWLQRGKVHTQCQSEKLTF